MHLRSQYNTLIVTELQLETLDVYLKEQYDLVVYLINNLVRGLFAEYTFFGKGKEEEFYTSIKWDVYLSVCESETFSECSEIAVDIMDDMKDMLLNVLSPIFKEFTKANNRIGITYVRKDGLLVIVLRVVK